MATLTVKSATLSGTDASLVAAAGGGDAAQPGDHMFLRLKNGSGSTITVTINSVAPDNYGVDQDVVVSVLAAADIIVGPLPAQRFAFTDGLVHWTYSGVTSLTVGAFTA